MPGIGKGIQNLPACDQQREFWASLQNVFALFIDWFSSRGEQIEETMQSLLHSWARSKKRKDHSLQQHHMPYMWGLLWVIYRAQPDPDSLLVCVEHWPQQSRPCSWAVWTCQQHCSVDLQVPTHLCQEIIKGYLYSKILKLSFGCKWVFGKVNCFGKGRCLPRSGECELVVLRRLRWESESVKRRDLGTKQQCPVCFFKAKSN